VSVSIITDALNLLSFGLSDKQTGHWQATTGTPCEVPVPKNVSFTLRNIVLYKNKDCLLPAEGF
jgi:hypothetical protein